MTQTDTALYEALSYLSEGDRDTAVARLRWLVDLLDEEGEPLPACVEQETDDGYVYTLKPAPESSK